MLGFLDDIELEYTASDQKGDCYSAEPPGKGDADSEARDHEEDAAYCVADNG